MKARVVLLLAVAAIAIAEADQTADTMNKLNTLRAQQAKWMDILKGKSGYVMNTKSGKHFVTHGETVSQKVCDGKKEKVHLLGQDEASLPPQFRHHGQHRDQHLLGQDDASLPPQFRGRHNKRDRRAVPQMVGQDRASLPPAYLPVSHSISDVFGVLKNALKTSCAMTIQYHRFGYPMHVNVTSCKKFPALVRHIRLPDVTLVARNIHISAKICSKPQALKHAAPKLLVQHFEALAALSPPKVEISGAVKKVMTGVAKLARTHSIGPVHASPKQIMKVVKESASALAAKAAKESKKAGHASPLAIVAQVKKAATELAAKKAGHAQEIIKEVKKAATKLAAKKTHAQEIMKEVKKTATELVHKKAAHAQEIIKEVKKAAAKTTKGGKQLPIPVFLPGPVVFPVDAAVPSKHHAPAKKGMMTGANPAVFTDVVEDEELEHHRGGKMPHPKPSHGKDHRGKPHHGKDRHDRHHDRHHDGKHGHDHHHRGGDDDSWMVVEDNGKFSHFWHSKAHQFRHFVMRHPWVLPTCFAVLGLIAAAIILIAVYYARKRRAARNQDGGHALLINEDKKVLVDDEDELPASVYVNQVSA